MMPRFEADVAEHYRESAAGRKHERRFWRDVVARDASLRPLFLNPKIVRRLKQDDGRIP